MFSSELSEMGQLRGLPGLVWVCQNAAIALI